MGIFAVKNDKGKWLSGEVYQDDPKFISGGGSAWADLDKAKFFAKANGGHVVELVEAPEKISVSEEAVAKILREVKRYADDYISEDKLELEIKMALSAYKPAGVAEKVVVSEEEAEMLEQAKDDYCAASVISAYSTEHIGAMGQDRLMRAYVNGWTVAKPKRYLARVPHANRHYYYQKCDSGEVIPVWDMETEPPTQFTDAEIEHYGLQYCECVEVTNHEQ